MLGVGHGRWKERVHRFGLKFLGKRPYGILSCKWENYIKMDIRDTGSENIKLIKLF
jgi:hypothetical protein